MSYSDINSNVAVFGSTGIAVKQAADGAIFVTGTILNMTGSYTGTLPVSGTVNVGNFPTGFNANITGSTVWLSASVVGTPTVAVSTTGFYARQGASTKLAQVGTAVIKNAAGRVGSVSVLVSGAVGAIYDTTAGASASGSNQVAVVPAVVGVFNINFPCAAGIVYVAGAGQTASISYE